jgi:CheY-like chemotaxis protein
MPHDPCFLYVEDEPMSRTVMQMLMVRKMGYKNLTIFEDSGDFIAKVENLPSKPDIIFLDIHMQPNSGFEMLQMLRNNPNYKKVRVVALTASVMNEEIELLRNAGFDGGIAKPIDQLSFPDVLERILKGEEVWNIF